MMAVKRYHGSIDRIVAKDTQLERLATGFKFTEGPVWDSARRCLYFSDIPPGIIYRWSPEAGIQVHREPSGNANGLTLDPGGRLLACEHGNRRVSRGEQGGVVRALATHYQGKRLNSPNDIVVRADGSIYFTDPPYGLPNQSEGKEMPFQGVYRLLPESGEVTLLVDDFERPNGLAFSPDEQVLYIDDSARQHVRAFDVKADGTLTNGRLMAELDPSVGEGAPDGLKVDREGNLYVTGPGGVWVISPAGERLGVLLFPEVPANLAWGGDDWRTLYVTARTSLYQVRLKIPGVALRRH